MSVAIEFSPFDRKPSKCHAAILTLSTITLSEFRRQKQIYHHLDDVRILYTVPLYLNALSKPDVKIREADG